MTTQLLIIIITLAVFVIFGFAMSKSISNYEKKKATVRKKR